MTMTYAVPPLPGNFKKYRKPLTSLNLNNREGYLFRVHLTRLWVIDFEAIS